MNSGRFTMCCGKCRQPLIKTTIQGTWRLICPEVIGSNNTEHSVYLTYIPSWLVDPNWDGLLASSGLLMANLQGLPLTIMEHTEFNGKKVHRERNIAYEGVWPLGVKKL